MTVPTFTRADKDRLVIIPRLERINSLEYTAVPISHRRLRLQGFIVSVDVIDNRLHSYSRNRSVRLRGRRRAFRHFVRIVSD